jgi:RNA polymerase sigma-70 factor (ECF subfamily)
MAAFTSNAIDLPVAVNSRPGSPICLPDASAERPEAGSNQVVIIAPMTLEELSEEALLAGYQSASDSLLRERHIDELFRRNYQKVARWCYRFTSDRESATDLAQEIFVKAYQNFSSFQGDCKFSTWLFTISRNHCINAIRSRSTQPMVETDDELFMEIADVHQENAESKLLREADQNLARTLINEALDDTEKAVFTLHFGDELPLDSVTRMLGLENASGAKAFIVSGKRKLARAVERWKAKNSRVKR